jgi:hypothetical protein
VREAVFSVAVFAAPMLRVKLRQTSRDSLARLGI